MSNGNSPLTMETREDPRFVQFATGEIVEGVLFGMDRITIKDKPGVRYIVREDNGQFCAFIGTYQLNSKLRPQDRGHRISVKCIGEDVMVKRGDNCMKVFEVKVSKEAVTRAIVSGDPTEITDDDIPF